MAAAPVIRALLAPIATATGLAKTVPIGKPAQMRAGTLRTWLRFPTWCCVALLGFLSLLPAQEMMRTGFPGEVEHFAAYAGSAAIAMAGYGLNRSRLLIIGLFCVYAGILEYLQHLSPGRHPAFLDFEASALGALCGGVAIILLWRSRLPSRCSTEKEAR
jgi:VanZ family protein